MCRESECLNCCPINHSGSASSGRLASSKFMQQALNFARSAKEQMGAEVFMLAGWQDERGNIMKAKWVSDICLHNYLINTTLGFRLLGLWLVASRINSIRLELRFGGSGISIWLRHGMVSNHPEPQLQILLTGIQMREEGGITLIRRRCFQKSKQMQAYHGICPLMMRGGLFSLWNWIYHCPNWKKSWGHFWPSLIICLSCTSF